MPKSHTQARRRPDDGQRLRVGLSASQQRRIVYRWIGIGIVWALLMLAQLAVHASPPGVVLALAMGAPALLLILYVPMHVMARRKRRRAMIDAGLICGRCDYLMRGLDETVRNCPECGHPREALPKNDPWSG